MQAALGQDRVVVQRGAYLQGRGGDGEIDAAVHACRAADACVLLLGLTANNPKAASQARLAAWLLEPQSLALPGEHGLHAAQRQRNASPSAQPAVLHWHAGDQPSACGRCTRNRAAALGAGLGGPPTLQAEPPALPGR